MSEQLIGNRFRTKHSGDCQIISMTSRKDITVEFEDGYRTTCTLANLKAGAVLNPFHPKIYGVGFMGDGDYKAKINGVIHPFYDAWRGALRRSYDIAWHKRQPKYEGCSVDERWHNYQDFCKWSDQQVFEVGYKLDKDLLILDNKLYGPDTCVYLPNELNCIISDRWKERDLPKGVNRVTDPRKKTKLFTANCQRKGRGCTIGYFETPEEAAEVYKKTKESYVKERAEFWKNQISLKAYEALMVWKVPE